MILRMATLRELEFQRFNSSFCAALNNKEVILWILRSIQIFQKLSND